MLPALHAIVDKQDAVASMTRKSQFRLMIIALCVFLLGAIVYLFDRSATDIYFIPDWWVFADGTPELFGALGGSFPAFAHTFAFALLFSVLLAPWRVAPGIVCMGWSATEALLEISQVDFIGARIQQSLPGWLADWPILANVPFYFSSGHYDPLDLLNILLGGAAAWLTVELANRYGVIEK